MKIKSKYVSVTKVTILLVTVIVLLSVTSCSTSKHSFEPSSIVPAATGKVKVKEDKNKNHSVEVNITNLASPENLSPPKKTYVVWMVTDNSVTKNIGQIRTSSGLLSKAKKASLNTSSSFKPTKIFITAEDDGTITYPLGETVLTTSNF